jgi:pseudaminic acid synthase
MESIFHEIRIRELTRSINLGKTQVGLSHRPVVIAELSGNHGGSLERALNLVRAAAASGVDGIKLQTYTPETMTLNIARNEFIIGESSSLWSGRSLFDLYVEGQTPWEWHGPIFALAKDLDLLAFSTPFDSSAAEFLDRLGAPCFKIASSENTDLPLIRKVASFGKPIIISTGMATLSEIEDAVGAARISGCKDLILLKCSASYPADSVEANLRTIPNMREIFDCEVGISDHTLGIGTSITAVALGATLIEKHFTLDKLDGAVDSKFSMDPAEMKQLVGDVKESWASLGNVKYGPSKSEELSIRYRRSLYVVEDMQLGETISSKNVRAIRPGLGMPIKNLDIVIGRRVNQKILKGTPLTWEIIS